MWVDKYGNNLSSGQVRELLAQIGCFSGSVADLEKTYRVGKVYANGTAWFQRIG